MAIQQTVTFTKTGSAFADYTEAQTDINATITDLTQKTALDSAIASGDVTTTTDFDAVSQVITYTRTWNEDAYNAYKSSHTTTGNTNKASLEAAGWTVTESVATV